MTYTVLGGLFVIRYPDLPRQGPEPDGDTVKFRPDTPGLVEALPRVSGTPPDINARGISVRLEAIDALETHFGETHQELVGANARVTSCCAGSGSPTWCSSSNLPNKVQSADQDHVRGHVLSNGIDANGRMIGFVYPGDQPGPDGATVFVDEPWWTLGQRVAARRRARLPGLLRHPARQPAYPPGRPRTPHAPPPTRPGCGPAPPPTPTARPPSPISPPWSSW